MQTRAPCEESEKDNVHYDIQCSPQDYLPCMLRMMKVVEAHDTSAKNACPMRSNVVPKRVRIDTTSLMNLCFTKEHGKQTDCLKGITSTTAESSWCIFFKTNMKCFHVKGCTFGHQIVTDGVGCSSILKRKNLSGERMIQERIKKCETYIDEVVDYESLKEAGYDVYLVDEFRVSSSRCSACEQGECETFRKCENPRPYRSDIILRHELARCTTCSRLWGRDTNVASDIWKAATSAIPLTLVTFVRQLPKIAGDVSCTHLSLKYMATCHIPVGPRGTLQPEKSMRAVSPLKPRDQQHHKLSSNAASPVRPAAHGVQRADYVDETRLLRAIQALDSDESQGKSKTSSGNPVCTTRAAKRVCEALGFLLELLLLLEHQSVQECSDARAELETIWEARILGCLKRFVTKRKHVDAKFVGCSCGDQCVQQLVCYTLVSILFRLSRNPRLANGVVKNELHELLLFDLYSESPDPISIQNTTTANNQDKLDSIDPRDLLLSIDPFDWCYQSTCSRIAEEETQNAVFFVPVGVRSLMYLLAGDMLPTDEITEYDTKLRHCLENTSGGFCFNVPSQATSSKKKNQLPSIFAFPTKEGEERPTPSDFSGRSASTLCSRRSDTAFQMGRSQTALQHMAIRSAVALLQNLQRSPSSERKLLLRDGKCAKMLVLAVAAYGNAGPQQTPRDSTKSADLNRLLSCQKMAFDRCLLARMAQSGLSLLHQDEIKSFLKKQPELRELAKQQQLFQEAGIAALNPSTPSYAKIKKKPTKPKVPSTLPLAERLQAASEESRRESAAAEVSALERDVEVERSLQRQQLRGQCDKLEQLRHQLSQSLSLLRSGRPHADPNQSFVSWIASFPTIEKKAQEQQLNAQMQQQHAVEMTFQREEARKQKLKECAMMQQNDHDAMNDTKNSRKEQKRLEFLRIHEEMKLLQEQQEKDAQDGSMLGIIYEVHQLADDDGNGDHTELNDIQAKILHQRTLAAQRKARQLKLDEEQKRLLWMHQRKQEAKELERMGKEDLYYVEKLSRLKQFELEKQKLLLAQKQQSDNPIKEQQRKIERMRQLDLERKLAEKETERMRTEDLFARQLRYLDTERRSLEAQHERLARKHMDAEERDCRIRYKLIAREQAKLEELEAKRLRVEAKKLQKRQREYEKQVLAAWVESWDANGNVYYYNSVTGISQWESPFSTQ